MIHFGRPMMRLAATLDGYAERWSVLGNIVEEHGGGALEHTHGASFRGFLRSLSSSCEPFASSLHGGRRLQSVLGSSLFPRRARPMPWRCLPSSRIDLLRFLLGLARQLLLGGGYHQLSCSIMTYMQSWILNMLRNFRLIQSRWSEQSADICRGLYDGNRGILGTLCWA